MMTIDLLSNIFALTGGFALPATIAYVGAGLLAAAVVGAVAGGVVAHVKHRKNPMPDAFESMVEEEMRRQGVEQSQEQAAQDALPEEEDLLEEDVQAEEDAQEAAPKTLQTTQEEFGIDEDAEVQMAAGGNSLADDEEIEPEEMTLVHNDETPLGEDDMPTDEEVPDPIPIPASAAAQNAVAIDVMGSRAEEQEIVAAAVDAGDAVNPDDSLLDSMTSKDNEYDEFDFDGDFDSWVDEIEQADFDGDGGVNALLLALGTDADEAEDEAEEEDFGELDIDDEDAGAAEVPSDDELLPEEQAAGGFVGSKYRRSFRSKLMQGSPANKRYYSIIKNELMSYDKIRCSESWSGESYQCGRRTYVRLGIAGKTLCVFLALDPAGYDPNLLHHRDKSNVRKYASTPMMMRVRSDLALRRTITLILYIVKDNGIRKKADFRPVDYAAGLRYADDEALLALNLIKLNPRYVQKLSSVEELEAEEAEARRRQFRDVPPVKPEQLGNLTDEDIDRLERKRERTDATTRHNASDDGKFVVVSEEGMCRFMYYAPSGRLLCISDTYSSTELAVRAVAAYRSSIAAGKAEFSVAEGKYFYTVHAHGRVFTSTNYDTQSACLAAYKVAREHADNAVVEYSI